MMGFAALDGMAKLIPMIGSFLPNLRTQFSVGNPDHLAVCVEQRTARITGIECGIRLNERIGDSCISRSTAETMPDVTVPLKFPSGFLWRSPFRRRVIYLNRRVLPSEDLSHQLSRQQYPHRHPNDDLRLIRAFVLQVHDNASGIFDNVRIGYDVTVLRDDKT